jgi:uncharacterized repeat protein (TIGR01451 family)
MSLTVARPATAQSTYYLWTGQTSAQTQIDTNHTSSWHIIVHSGSFAFGGGNFTMKAGSSASATVTLKLYQGSSTGGTVLASVTQAASAVTGQFTPLAFAFSSVQTLTTGRYYVTLTSTAPDVQSQAFFIKGVHEAIISVNGSDPIDGSIAESSATPEAANLTVENTATASVEAGGTITYTLKLGNDGGSPSGTAATVADQLPTGVTATRATAGSGVSSVSCTNLNNAGARLTCTLAITSIASAAPPTDTFTITATAPSSTGSITNYASVDPGGGASPAVPSSSCSTTSCSSATTTVTGPDLTLSKTASAGTLTRGGTGTFTLTVTNGGSSATNGSTVTVTDNVPSGLTPTSASGTGWSCAINGQVLTCTRTDALAANGSYPAITLNVSIASNAGTPLTNAATVSGGGDTTDASGSVRINTADPAVPALTLSKTASASTLTRGSTGSFTLTVTNSGNAVTDGTTVTVTDSVPSGLTPSSASGTGWSCSISSQDVTCTRSDALAASGSYPAIAVNVSIASNAAASLTNTASVAGGGDSSSASGSVTVSTADPTAPSLTITKSASAATLTRGTTGSFTLTVTNSGNASTNGTTVTASDSLPAGLTPSSASGTGWTCSISGQDVTCTRGDALSASASYAAITINASVAANAGASLTNTASVSGGGDSTAATGSVTVSTADPSTPSLTIEKTASAATLTRGGTGSFTLTVTNGGSAATDGTTVTVSDSLPSGLTPTSASGTGWACTLSGQDVTCTRTSALNASSAYPSITVAVSVASNAAASLTNTASVVGGGDGSSASGSVTVSTADASVPSLTLSKTVSAATLTRGGTGSFTLTVTNGGTAATDGSTVTVTDSTPAGLTPTSATGTGWTCTISGQDVSCTRTTVLATSSSYPPVTVNVTVASNAGASLTNSASVVGGGDSSAGSGSVSFNTADPTVPSLTMTNTASAATLTRSGTASFTLLVTKGGTAATDGTTVTVSDSFPAGLTPTSASGTGWTCSVSGQDVSCTRTSVLNTSSDYPAITVNVSVAGDAAASLTDTASVSGGGDSSAATASASVNTVAAPAPSLTITNTASAATLTRGGSGAFTLTATNDGNATTDGTTVTVGDTLPAGLTPTAASGTGWTCSLSGQNVSCTRASVLATSSSYPAITVGVSVAANAAASLTSTATVGGGGDASDATASVTVSTVVATAPSLTLSKTASATTVTRGGSVTFSLVATNSGDGATDGTTATVTDSLPAGLVPATASGTGWSCAIAAQVVTCTRTDALAANGRWPAISITASVGSGAAASLTNTASISGGGDSTAATGEVSLTTTAPTAPSLVLTNTPATTTLIPGGSQTYTLSVANDGDGATDGTTVTVTEVFPSGLTPTAVSGSGWNCSISAQTVTCTTTTVLAAGGSYPSISVTTAVASSVTGSLTATGTVSGGGDASAATAAATAAPAGIPSLTVSATPASPTITRGGVTSFILTVTNSGDTPTNGTAVTMTDTLPAGLTLTAASGAGCTCSVQAQVVTCTRTDVAAATASYPAITIAVTVSATANGSLTATATVSGGGDATEATADAIVSTSGTPSLALVKTSDSTSVQRGAEVNFSLSVTNRGTAPTFGAVTVTDTLPRGLSAHAAEGTGWACVVASEVVTCSRSDVLAVNAAYPSIDVATTVAGDAPGSLTNTASVSGGGDAAISTASTAAAGVTIDGETSSITFTKVHQGDFIRGDLEAKFFLIVSNVGRGTAHGSSRVTDNVPGTLIPVRAEGTGWACTIQGQFVACTRNDDLPGSSSFPPVEISVFVPTNAPDAVVNAAGLNGTIVTQDIVAVSDAVSVVDPMPVDLQVTKTVDRPRLRIGDQAIFTVGAGNPSRFVLDQVGLRDTLPPGFIYVPGSAVLRVTGPRLEDLVPGQLTTSSVVTPGLVASPATLKRAGVALPSRTVQAVATAPVPVTTVTRSIEGTVVNGEVSFTVGQLVPGAKAEIDYKTVVAPVARPGRFDTKVVGSALSPLGEQVVTVPVNVEVLIVDDPFSVTQVLIGRVFDDANGNGEYDAAETGVPNVRVVTATGLSAITDSLGQYNLPSLAAGSTLVSIDPATVPRHLMLPKSESRFGGGAQLLRTPLEGGSLLRQNFPLVAREITLPGVVSGPGRHWTERAPAQVEQPHDDEPSVSVTTARDRMAASGLDRQLVTLQTRGEPQVRGGKEPPIRVRTTLGMLAPVSDVDPAQCEAGARVEEQTALVRELTVEPHGGQAAVCLISGAEPGDALLQATADPTGSHSGSARVRFDPASHTPLLVRRRGRHRSRRRQGRRRGSSAARRWLAQPVHAGLVGHA